MAENLRVSLTGCRCVIFHFSHNIWTDIDDSRRRYSSQSETPLAGLLTSDGCQYETAAICSSSPPLLQARFWDKFIHNPRSSAPSLRQVGAKPAPSAGAARPYNKSTNNGAEKSQPNGGTGHR
ncbi:hypothetical protein T12_2147 [Trichinella patagoniensis]|uniref:Uncharacterized protein n=1 Tax=Trichinella patagoniensis TaxID=990121 RepID=A0A0V1A112_9BILA|nr:hypothetical protein T12_2147 [Trichinella patagoniensis]